MKKVLLIGLACVVIVAGFLLMREPVERSVSAPVSPAVAQVVEKQETGLSQSVIGPDAPVRIPLPNPELPALNRDLVPVHLYPLFGWEDIGGYVPRRSFVEAIDHVLSAEEVRALLMFVRSKPADVGLSDEDFNGVGDVVLLKLEEQKSLYPEYTDHLAVMFYDESLNSTWRDYCIQHIGTVYPRTPADKHPVIRQLYEDALAPGSKFAGTTMLSMKRSAGTPDMPEAFVADRAFEVASSTAYGDAERLSALHVAATFQHPEATDLAREIAVSNRSAIFRAASIAVIGLTGDASDQPLLQKYVKSSDIRLRVASAEALKNLNRE